MPVGEAYIFKSAMKKALGDAENDDVKSRCMVNVACIVKIADIAGAFVGVSATELLEDAMSRTNIDAYIAHCDMLITIEKRIADGILPQWVMPLNIAWINVKGFNSMFTEDKIKVLLDIGHRVGKESIKTASWSSKVPLTRAYHVMMDKVHDRVGNIDFGGTRFEQVVVEYEAALTRVFAVKDAVEDTVEDTVKDTVEDTVEEAVEDAVEDAVEEVVEDTVDDAVKDTVEEAVKDAVKDTVEDAVKDTVEDAVKDTVEDVRNDTQDNSPSHERMQLAVEEVRCLLEAKGRRGSTAMLSFVQRRRVGVVSEDFYDDDPKKAMDEFVEDVQTARTAIHAQQNKVKVVSMCVLMNVLEATCNRWLCADVAPAAGMPTSSNKFILALEERISGVEKLTVNTLRLYLRSLSLLVDLETHINATPKDAYMMPDSIQALNVSGFASVTLETYLELMKLTGRKSTRGAIKRCFSQI